MLHAAGTITSIAERSRMFVGFARCTIRYRGLVLGAALLLTPVLALYGGGVFGDLKPGGFDDSSSQSFHTDKALLAAGLAEDADLIALYTVHSGRATDPLLSIKVRTALHRAALDRSVVRILNYYDIGAAQLISNDGLSTFIVISMRGSDQAKIDALKRLEPELQVPGLSVKFGGISPVFQALNDTTESDVRRAELITLPITALLLIVIFGSVVAATVPLVLGGLAIVSAFTLLRLIAQVTDVSIFAASIITVLGLGLAIDYSLFILNRYREELPARGAEGALTLAMATTGRAVAFSGVTLAASLAGLFLFPQNFLRSMAIGGIAIAVLVVILTLTVLPALIAVLGPRVNALRLPWVHADTTLGHHELGFWRRIAFWVMRHAVAVAVLVTALLLLLASPFLRLRGSIPDVRVLSTTNEARQVSDALERDFFPHQTTPHQILLTGTAQPLNERSLAALYDYEQHIEAIPGVARVDSLFRIVTDRDPTDFSPFLPSSDYFQSPQFASAIGLFVQGFSIRIDVVPAAAIDSGATQAQVA
ncbi:MAG: MMPL family transporter, partial [Dehalococcoidia bacterium]